MFITRDISAVAPNAGDDYWFQPTGMMSASGQQVTIEKALGITAIYSCVKVLSEDVAKLSIPLYRKLANGGKEKMPAHPMYTLLNKRPNKWQTPFEWREMMMWHVLLRGNAYSEIITQPNGLVSELIPINPDKVKIELLPGNDYRYVYSQDGGERVILRGEMLHLRGQSSNGFYGMSPIEVEREPIGVSIAVQDYGARFYKNDARPPGWIEHPGSFKDEQQKNNFKSSWRQAQSGENRHSVAVLEYGLKYHEIGVKNEDVQFIETKEHQIEEAARIYRVPQHKISHLKNATFSNIEHQALEYVQDSLMPWLVRFEQTIMKDLLGDTDNYFVEFLIDSLLRGDIQSRYAAYSTAINTGFMTRNEARIKENWNPIDGLDEPLQPLNMQKANERLALMNKSTAEAIAKKEFHSINSALSKEDSGIKINEFLSKHADYVASKLHISQESAASYVADITNELMANDIKKCLESWVGDKTHKLVALCSD